MRYTTRFAAILFLTITSTASFADEIYQAPAGLFFKTKSILSQGAIASEIVDEIPQIGVLVLKQKTNRLKGWEHLGAPKLIQLDLPKAEVTQAPKRLWGLKFIEAEAAWAKTKGEGIVVAVSDTGIDSDHPDLAENMWVNSKEIKNGVDDDGNGYVDDIYGWDFVKKQGSGLDHHYHGTHVAGTVAAREGDRIAGVAPRAQLMDVSFLDSRGSGSEINGAKSIIYAADNGARIINCSWGAPGSYPVIADAIRYAQSKGVLVVAAAGNAKTNTDRKPHSPSSENVANIISVAASSSQGYKADFSNFGVVTVDLAAPGVNILSAAPSRKKASYQTLSGTSMASPHTAGAAALVWSLNPNASWLEVKEKLLMTASPKKSWAKRVASGGILNAKNAVLSK